MGNDANQYDGMDQPLATLAEESDAGLLELISWRDEDEALATLAWEQFYSRHVNFLYDRCYGSYRKSLGHDSVNDLVANTFLRVFTYSAALFTAVETWDDETTTQKVRSWLTRIAMNLACDEFRQRSQRNEINLTPEHWGDINQFDAAGSGNCDRVKRLAAILDRELDDREKEILSVTGHFAGTCKRLPNNVAAELAKRLGTTTENLRKIRERARKKILAAIEDEGLNSCSETKYE